VCANKRRSCDDGCLMPCLQVVFFCVGRKDRYEMCSVRSSRPNAVGFLSAAAINAAPLPRFPFRNLHFRRQLCAMAVVLRSGGTSVAAMRSGRERAKFPTAFQCDCRSMVFASSERCPPIVCFQFPNASRIPPIGFSMLLRKPLRKCRASRGMSSRLSRNGGNDRNHTHR